MSPDDAVLHICGGKAREYPYRGFGVNDKTLDLDPACAPDFLQDARDVFPLRQVTAFPEIPGVYWDAVLIDRPYTKDDAAHYVPGADTLPELNDLVKRALQIVPVGHRIASLDYLWPHPGKHGREVATVAVSTGRNNRIRVFSVFERLA